MNSVYFALSLLLPFLFAVLVKGKLRALTYGTIAFWALMIAAAQRNLASDPDNSMASGITIVTGWLFGLIYSGFCLSVVAGISAASKRFRRGN